MMTTLLVAVLSAVPCEDFGYATQNTWNEGKDPITPALDVDVILERATAGLRSTSSFLSGFREGVRNVQLGAALRKGLDEGSAVTVFLRCRQRAGFPTALFSVRYKDGGFGHFELELRSRRSGGVRVVDVWTSYEGEWHSVNLRRMVLLLMPSSEPGAALRARLFGDGLVLTDEHIKAISAFTAAAKARDAKTTERHFAEMHPALQKDRSIMGLRVLGTQNDPEATTTAVEAYIAAFPEDPSVALKAFDYHFTRKDYDACLGALDVLERTLGLDPWLEVLRARVELAAKHLGVATEHADRAIELEPWNVQAWFTAIQCALDRKDHPRTSRLLDGAMKAGASYTRESLAAAEVFADFMRSPEGKRWRPPAAEPE